METSNLKQTDVKGISIWCRNRYKVITYDKKIIEEVLINDCYRLSWIIKQGISINSIVDVGCHIGTFSLFARKLFPSATLASFEPFPENYKIAKMNLGEIVRPLAVSCNGQFLVVDNPQNEGMNWVSNKNIEGSIPIQNISPLEAIPVGTDLLKLDCEGAEKEILERLSEDGRLGSIGFIVGEWHKNKSEVFGILERTHEIVHDRSLKNVGTFVAQNKSLRKKKESA